jgi:hypothetical protein
MSDQSHDKRDNGTTVAEAARVLGITEGAVRKRVERGKLAAEHAPDGRLLVYLGRDTTATDTTRDRPRQSRDERSAARYTSSLEEQVEYLRSQLDQEREANRENRRIIAALTSRIPAIEAPQEASESVETAEDQQGRGEPRPATGEAQEGVQRPWWRRMFGG